MIVDKNFCMSSFLAFRYVADSSKVFKEDLEHIEISAMPEEKKISCRNTEDIEECIVNSIKNVDWNKTAIMLSGGIDSGILASYVPKGIKAYTVANASGHSDMEVNRAAKICKKQGLEHVIVEVNWEDYDNSIDKLMAHDGCPVFANEPQVYTIAKKIKNDGHNCVIFGDNADAVFGGYDLLLSKDWTFDEWVKRFTFVEPAKVLKHPSDIIPVYDAYRQGKDGVDYIRFIREIFAISSSGAYVNAFDTIGIDHIDPYVPMKMAEPLDINRVRNGESKYLLRELYKKRFPDFDIPEKIAMARACDVWLRDWEGPVRTEFLPGCINGLSGEQKFLIYSLERFLNLMEIPEDE